MPAKNYTIKGGSTKQQRAKVMALMALRNKEKKHSRVQLRGSQEINIFKRKEFKTLYDRCLSNKIDIQKELNLNTSNKIDINKEFNRNTKDNNNRKRLKRKRKFSNDNNNNNNNSLNKKRKLNSDNLWNKISFKINSMLQTKDLNTLTPRMIKNTLKSDPEFNKNDIKKYKNKIKNYIKIYVTNNNINNNNKLNELNQFESLNNNKIFQKYVIKLKEMNLIHNIPSISQSVLHEINNNINSNTKYIGYWLLIVDKIYLKYDLIENNWNCANCNTINDKSYVFCCQCTMDNIQNIKLTEIDYYWLKITKLKHFNLDLSAKVSVSSNYFKGKGKGMIQIYTVNDNKNDVLKVAQNIRKYIGYKSNIKYQIINNINNEKDKVLYIHSNDQPDKLIHA